MVTDEQVRRMRRRRMEGKTQEAAAAAADMSERTARRWEGSPLPSETKQPRWWRTREDPFEAVWQGEVVPLLEADATGELQAKTILDDLMERRPGGFERGQIRTLQRKVRDWRAVHGPDREVMFPQEHPPARESAFDFTHCTELGVTILGELLVHLMFVFRLSFSGWTWVQVAFGETFEALVTGFQGAVWKLGGVTEVGRSDNLSAATHELRKSKGRGLNKRYKDVLDHYGMRSTRIKPGKSHENGGVEKDNDLVKTALEQALILRGSRDFESVAQYESFAREVVERRINAGAEEKLVVELDRLRPLPSSPVPNYTKYTPQVSSWSMVRVGGRLYSVPSRLIGHELEVHQYANVLEVYYRGRLIETMPRLRGDKTVRVDYRHVIWSLVRKPGAFGRYRFREELFPTLTFRRAYDALTAQSGVRADVEYVRILHLAASTMESQVERALVELLERGEPFDYAEVKAIAAPEQKPVPELHVPEPDLTVYDRLLVAGGAP